MGDHLQPGKLEFSGSEVGSKRKLQGLSILRTIISHLIDNNQLTYVMFTAKLNTTSIHWVGELAE